MIKKKVLIAGFLVGVFITGSIAMSNTEYSYAKDTKRVEDYTKQAGEFIKQNPKLFSESIDALKTNFISEEEISKVDLLTISVAEIEFRKGLRQLAGIGATDNKSIYNTLVEEKLIINYAIKNNVLPTSSDIDQFIESEKALYQQDETFNKAIDSFILGAAMSLEAYWNTYEYYNAFRIVTFKKAADFAINTGIQKGELKALEKDKPANPEILKEHGDYWKKIKKEMKDKVSVKVNEKFKNIEFDLDKTKLYL